MPRDSIGRLTARLTQRLREPVRRPERWVVEDLGRQDPRIAAAVIQETVNYTVAQGHNWYEACELLAEALRLGEDRDRVARLRAGNFALNCTVEAARHLRARR